MTRRTGGVLWGLLPGMFLLVLFRCLSVTLKCLPCVSELCVWLVYGETWLTLSNKSDGFKFCLFFWWGRGDGGGEYYKGQGK